MIRVWSIRVHTIIYRTKTKNILYQSTTLKNDNTSRWLSEENVQFSLRFIVRIDQSHEMLKLLINLAS